MPPRPPGPLSPLFRRASERHGLSLVSRIILINTVAMLLMMAGLFYFGRYLDRMINNEVNLMTQQAELIASTLGEVAVENTAEGDVLQTDMTRQIIRRLLQDATARAQVFAPNTLLIADSRLLRGGGMYVQVEPLPPPHSLPKSFIDYATGIFDWAAMLLPYGRNLPLYVDTALPALEQMPDAKDALKGERSWTIWRNGDNSLILTVAVPVQRLHQVVGAVMLTRGSAEIADTMRGLRVEMLQSFAVMLAISVLISAYMAQTIARPLRRLARAARRSQSIAGGAPVIPDYHRRGDEIGELSVALRAMTRALWQRLDAIERFAADVAHEIKNPLSSMKSALETLDRVKDESQRQRLIRILAEDVSRMDRLISDISSASRLEAELGRTAVETFDFVGLVSTLVTSRIQAGVPLDLHVSESGLLVRGIPSRLVQVAENLIGNALSFSPPYTPVIIRLSANTSRIFLIVDDSGPGIPDGKEEKIFERFYSERPHGEAFGTHSGLGLSICRQIVEGHGGRIYAQSRRDDSGKVAGARFTVELPRFLP